MSSDDVVIINDDNQKDSDIEVVDISKDNSSEQKSTQENNAIIIDDDIIEIIDVDSSRNNKDIKDYLTKVCSENRLIGEFIEKCLELENSDGMFRVIYRTFLPLYFKMEDGYSESTDFKKLIDMTMRALDVNPNLKFTHLKFVCDMMKSKSRDRKKVQFTTISSEVTAKPKKPRKQRKRRKRRSKLSSVKKSKKRKTEHVIELDESSNGEDRCNDPPALNPATDDVEILEDDNETSNTSNKENRILHQNSASTVQDSNIDVARANNRNIQWTPVSEASQQPGTRLDETGVECEKKERIKQIEKQIEFYKNVIDSLEQEEVKTDSLDSPYIRCERLKAHIVLLYKELCSLIGNEPVKKREIHFTATDGRSQLPLKILEKYINDNIGPDGNPCLPDFFDVMECVHQANECGGLGWDKPRVWNEARALFTFCGQALQDSRKKREWRYMLSLANSQVDDDPAERDPVLMARLEANRRVAVKKELDLLEQYVKMEEGRYDDESIPNDVRVSQDCSDDEFEENTFAASTSNTNHGVISTTVTNNVNICRPVNVTFNVVHNMGSIIDSVIYRAYEARFGNNQVQEMAVKQSHNHLKNTIDTRMLEISVGGNQNPEVRVVNVSNTNDIEIQKSQASSQDNNESRINRMIEVCVENNKPPEVKVINVTSSEHCKEGNVEQDSVTDNSTCLIEFDNSIRSDESFVETFEDTYRDFVKNRAENNLGKGNINNNSIVTTKRKNIPESTPFVIKDVHSVGSNQNGMYNSMKNSENMPLVIKEVYSVATKIDAQNDSTYNNRNNNVVESGNKSVLFNEESVPSKHNGPSTQTKTLGNNRSRSETSIASENLPILIKDVYSVATKQENSSIQVNSLGFDNSDVTETVKHPQGKPQEISSSEPESNKENVTVESQNDDATTVNTNSEEPKPVEEGSSVKVKTEISDLLKEMENFGDSFTATVFDIEDPFLVIEISDTSDESDDDLDR